MSAAGSYTLVLSGDASIKMAQPLAEQLRSAIEANSNISVDTQSLSGADLTTAQTLLAARAKASAAGKMLTLMAPLGGPLYAVIAAAGLAAQDAADRTFWTDLPTHPQGASL